LLLFFKKEGLPSVTDQAIAPAPALKALGGWSDAPWFTPAIMSDPEIVGFQFPPLPGVRKQNFQITDRSTAEKPKRGAPKTVPAKPPKRIAGKLSHLLDALGATSAVACGRARFLFESAPTLFFAELPLAKLKAKSANKLRRDLIEIGVTACLVSTEGPSAIVMLWPASETTITDFVQQAAPDHPLHIDFFKTPASASDPRPPRKRDIDRQNQLLREVTTLRQQIEILQQSQSARGAMEKLGLDEARLKSMLVLLHPDKHGGSEAANEAAKWLNGLRELLKAQGG
jgi:hypothetical protein